ncbi:MAG: hypothetical protein L6W00_27085 [Lentisphaeria bacterium]|nr:MAG: hypothetical protein L6W00_27085 [Lentisphaeria bacterium]
MIGWQIHDEIRLKYVKRAIVDAEKSGNLQSALDLCNFAEKIDPKRRRSKPGRRSSKRSSQSWPKPREMPEGSRIPKRSNFSGNSDHPPRARGFRNGAGRHGPPRNEAETPPRLYRKARESTGKHMAGWLDEKMTPDNRTIQRGTFFPPVESEIFSGSIGRRRSSRLKR